VVNAGELGSCHAPYTCDGNILWFVLFKLLHGVSYLRIAQQLPAMFCYVVYRPTGSSQCICEHFITPPPVGSYDVGVDAALFTSWSSSKLDWFVRHSSVESFTGQHNWFVLPTHSWNLFTGHEVLLTCGSYSVHTRVCMTQFTGQYSPDVSLKRLAQPVHILVRMELQRQ